MHYPDIGKLCGKIKENCHSMRAAKVVDKFFVESYATTRLNSPKREWEFESRKSENLDFLQQSILSKRPLKFFVESYPAPFPNGNRNPETGLPIPVWE